MSASELTRCYARSTVRELRAVRALAETAERETWREVYRRRAAELRAELSGYRAELREVRA